MPRTTQVRRDGETTGGPKTPGGQPNGRPFIAADVPKNLPYGERGNIQSAVAATPTPPPPGVSPEAHAAHLAMQSYRPNLTPLFAPTERPNEHILTGSAGPGGIGPPNPMAVPPPALQTSVASMLATMANQTSSPTISALAQRAAALGQ